LHFSGTRIVLAAMPNVVFAAPMFSPAASQMIEAAVSFPDTRVSVISQDPLERLAPLLRSRVAGHWRVNDVTDERELETAVRELASRYGRPDRCFGAYEQLQVPLALVRERLGIPGLPSNAAVNFRDKALMKDRLRAGGVSVARHRLIASRDDAIAFVGEVGFPIVMKPPAGAGARNTFRVSDAAALEAALFTHRPNHRDPMLAEEFLRGTEHSIETVSINGHAVWHSITDYAPTPLQVLENAWMQWCVLLPREVDDPRYDLIRQSASRALDVLGMDTGVSHCEWFRRADGTVAISEIGARPPGAQITTMISRANDIDFVAAWIRLMISGSFEKPERKYAVGTAYLRGQGSGVVRGIEGLDIVRRELDALICDSRLPALGQVPTGSYEGEGFIIVRHPDTDTVRRALQRIISVVRVRLA
jgi:D-alanine-D-alanine ligase-like ATP-grasp enzyme